MTVEAKRTTSKHKPSHKSNPMPRENYEEYEKRKAELSPDLTPTEYSNAVREIARECGV